MVSRDIGSRVLAFTSRGSLSAGLMWSWGLDIVSPPQVDRIWLWVD